MPGRHSVPVRGLMGTKRSPLFEGNIGRMFRALLPAFDPDDDSLEDIFVELGEAMSASFDPPKDGPDAEESGIPALYTYLGQFIDHYSTFAPASSRLIPSSKPMARVYVHVFQRLPRKSSTLRVASAVASGS